MSDKVYIGRRLKRERLKRTMTQVELASAAGISYRALSNLERNHTQPHPSTLVKLGKALGIDPASLIED